MDSEEKNGIASTIEVVCDTSASFSYGQTSLKSTDYQLNLNEISGLTINEIDFNNLNSNYPINLTGSNVNTIGGATGSAIGQVWTTNGTGTFSWPSTVSSSPVISAEGQMELRGEKADLRINNKSLRDWMEQVEQRLNILTPNPELEKEWDQLRRLGERYRKLEKQCQDKAEMWNKLKSMPPVSVK